MTSPAEASSPADEPTVESLLADIRVSRAASDLLRPKEPRMPAWGFMHGKELVMSMWRQADAHAHGVLLMASHSPPLERPISILARALYEGSMTLFYCSYNPMVRLAQMRIGCFEDYLKVTEGDWIKGLPEAERIAQVRARFEPEVAAAYKRQAEYIAEKEATKGGKPKNNWDRHAVLPNFRERMKSLGYDHLYDPMYGAQSSIAHWSLGGFVTAPDLREEPQRVAIVQAVQVASSEYRAMVQWCANFVGYPKDFIDAAFEQVSSKG